MSCGIVGEIETGALFAAGAFYAQAKQQRKIPCQIKVWPNSVCDDFLIIYVLGV
ncbi:hypothetical protein ykris0001_5870 [Yersinia kristensenii ATCC 33638]|nr:hypothetical protein ykris0001_5870 [Yersinia kristensenii ATCC 33638]